MDCFDFRFVCLFTYLDKFFIDGKIGPIGFFDLGLEENLDVLPTMGAERKTHDVSRDLILFHDLKSTDVSDNPCPSATKVQPDFRLPLHYTHLPQI
jgi:hypothetical protein